jgi:hypothetical protein
MTIDRDISLLWLARGPGLDTLSNLVTINNVTLRKMKEDSTTTNGKLTKTRSQMGRTVSQSRRVLKHP